MSNIGVNILFGFAYEINFTLIGLCLLYLQNGQHYDQVSPACQAGFDESINTIIFEDGEKDNVGVMSSVKLFWC